MGDDSEVLTRPAPGPDVTLPYGEHPEQVVDVRLPGGHGGPAPLVVVVHGGFWRPEYDRAHAGPQSAALADAGYVVATIEYRRGDRERLLSDVRTALDAAPALAERAGPGGVDAGRTVLVGHSAGGHLVLVAAQRPGAAGVVALAPVADLAAAEAAGLGGGAVRDFLGGPASDHPGLDPARLGPPAVPVHLLHGLDDDRVPAEQSRRYAAGHPGVTCELLPGTGHFALIDPLSAAWPRVLSAVARATGRAATLA